MRDGEVAPTVEARVADFGFTPSLLTREQQRLLVAEPSYILEVRLVARQAHPLARRRRVTFRDLRPYPLVNEPTALPSLHVRSVLAQHHACLENEHLLQACFATSIRHFVALGFGIG